MAAKKPHIVFDFLAFGAGLLLAWWNSWQTTDLLWSLWLASLVVGFSQVLLGVFSPCLLHVRENNPGAALAALLKACFTLPFFIVHFGIFHLVHAGIMHDFFPVLPGLEFPDLTLFQEVLRRYWYFLPMVFLAERKGFLLPHLPPEPHRTSVKAADIEVRKARQQYGSLLMFKPYLNVVRMHLLILLFATTHFLQIDNFLTYAVVYSVYFLPWGALFHQEAVAGTTS